MILFVILVLSSVDAVSADWQRYHADPQHGVELFIDLDTLHQTPAIFAADIRLSMWQGKQVFQGRQTVNCRDATHTLSAWRELVHGKDSGEIAQDEAGVIGSDMAMSDLKKLYCARWQEPAGVRWKAFATAPGITFFYDERVDQMRRKMGFKDGFTLFLKTQGVENSLLSEVRVSCRENSFAIVSGTNRDEARGWLANIEAGASRSPAPGSSIANLISLLCTPTNGVGEKPIARSQGDVL